MGNRSSPHQNASGQLPNQWWNDQMIADEIYDRIRRLVKMERMHDREVARRIGCSSKTVLRFRRREKIPANEWRG